VGSVLDSTTVIAAERARQTAQQFLLAVSQTIGNEPVALSAVGYTELLHGLYRESDPERRRRRDQFFSRLLSVVPVIPYTIEIAKLAGRISGKQAAIGQTIPLVDLMIGATALSIGFSLLTSNERHFRMVPNLHVITF
jgi:predicted nucleic acid-binding protein